MLFLFQMFSVILSSLCLQKKCNLSEWLPILIPLTDTSMQLLLYPIFEFLSFSNYPPFHSVYGYRFRLIRHVVSLVIVIGDVSFSS